MYTTGPARVFKSDKELEQYLNRMDEIKWGLARRAPFNPEEADEIGVRSAPIRAEGAAAPKDAVNPYPDFTNARRWWAEGNKKR